MNKNPYWMRVETYNPNKYAERERRAKEEKRMREHAAPTLFDVQEYAQKTGREAYARDIGHLDIPALDRALTQDIASSDTQENATRLRHLLLTTIQEGYMRPQVDLEQIKKDLLQEYRSAIIETRAMERACDETEQAEQAEHMWQQLLQIFDTHAANPDALLEFTEDQLRTAYTFQKTYPKNTTIKKRIQTLRQIRTAVYWRLLHPEVNLITQKAA